MKKEILELADAAGASVRYERYSADMSVGDFEYGLRYKDLCAACPEHGKRFSCPPHSPFFPDYVGKAQKALVFCVRFPRELFPESIEEKEFLTMFFRKAGSLLGDILLEYRKTGCVVAGSGPCLACDTCAAEEGSKECTRPQKRIYSLESLGVNVADLCRKAFGLDLEWSSDGRQAGHVCAVGSAFL